MVMKISKLGQQISPCAPPDYCCHLFGLVAKVWEVGHVRVMLNVP
jgi:hypothetical protein